MSIDWRQQDVHAAEADLPSPGPFRSQERCRTGSGHRIGTQPGDYCCTRSRWGKPAVWMVRTHPKGSQRLHGLLAGTRVSRNELRRPWCDSRVPVFCLRPLIYGKRP